MNLRMSRYFDASEDLDAIKAFFKIMADYVLDDSVSNFAMRLEADVTNAIMAFHRDHG